MKTILLIIALAITTAAQATIHTITQQGTTFSPANLQVSVGDVVRWVWTSGAHTTTSKSIPAGAAGWDSPLTSGVQSFEYTVTVAGTYNYVCTPHESMGMVGQFTASATTGIINKTLASEVSLYPQPATSELNIQFKNGFTADELFISDLLGKTVLSQTISSEQQENPVNIDVSSLKPGLFFIGFLSNKKKVQVLRFVKQ